MSANDDFEINIPPDNLYHTFSLMYMHFLPRTLRKVIEFVVLFVALLFFYEFISFHNMLAHSANCLDHVIDKWPKNGVIRVEIIQSYERYPGQTAILNYFRAVDNSYERDYRLENILYIKNKNFSLFKNAIETCNPENKEKVDIETSTVEIVENKFRETSTPKPNFYSESLTNNINVEDEKEQMPTPSKFHAFECSNSYTKDVLGYLSYNQPPSTSLPSNETNNKGIFYENYIVEYSLKNENLFFSSDVRDRLGIPVMLITLDPTKNKCFGNRLSRYLLENYIGYDELVYASFKTLATFQKNRGFFRNIITSKYCPIINTTYKDRVSYISSFINMIMTTGLISLYIRFLKHQLFVCLNNLLNDFNGDLGLLKLYASIIGFIGLISLMCVHFKNIEAFSFVIFIVVISELYYSSFTQCPTTKKQWPKFFYLYLYAFYAYDYRFDGQYRLLNIACSWYFILHSMIYFYHHVELPNVLRQIELQEIIIQQDRPDGQWGFLAP